MPSLHRQPPFRLRYGGRAGKSLITEFARRFYFSSAVEDYDKGIKMPEIWVGASKKIVVWLRGSWKTTARKIFPAWTPEKFSSFQPTATAVGCSPPFERLMKVLRPERPKGVERAKPTLVLDRGVSLAAKGGDKQGATTPPMQIISSLSRKLGRVHYDKFPRSTLCE